MSYILLQNRDVTLHNNQVHKMFFKNVFFRTYPLLFHKFGNIVIFRSGNLYSLCSPGNQDYPKIILIFLSKKVEITKVFIGISCNY